MKKLGIWLIVLFSILPFFQSVQATEMFKLPYALETGEKIVLYEVEPDAQIERLNRLSVDEIEKQYPEKTPEQLETDHTYYGFVKKGKQRSRRFSPFLFLMPEILDHIEIKPSSGSGHLKIYKKDKTTNKPLSGVEFRLYIQEEDLVPVRFKSQEFSTDITGNENLTTNDQGVIQLKHLPQGEYVLKEVKHLEGYKPLKQSMKVIIHTDKTTEKTVYNEKEHTYEKTSMGQTYGYITMLVLVLLVLSSGYVYKRI